MSAQQFFNEVEAVVPALQEFVERFNDTNGAWTKSDEWEVELDEPYFTAIWQAAELLARAHSVLLPMMQFESMKRLALDIPDPQKPAPKQPKKSRLYGPDGKPV